MLSMSAYNPSDQFSAAEKVELLVNILQTLVPDLPSYLFNCVVSDVQQTPRWLDTALPNRRSLHSCQIAFEEMRKTYAPHSGSTRQFPPAAFVNIAPNLSTNRSVSAQDYHFHSQRQMQHIQPRPVIRTTESPHPMVTSGESPLVMRGPLLESIPGSSGSRKRGRPSKEEVAERTARYAAEGKVYQPKKRPSKKPRPSGGTEFPEISEMKDEEPSTPLLQTPIVPSQDPSDRASSSRRRQRRTDRDDSPTTTMGGGGTGLQETLREMEQEQGSLLTVAESPSDRLLPGHRDRGSIGSSLSRRTQQGSDSADQGHMDTDYLT